MRLKMNKKSRRCAYFADRFTDSFRKMVMNSVLDRGEDPLLSRDGGALTSLKAEAADNALARFSDQGTGAKCTKYLTARERPRIV